MANDLIIELPKANTLQVFVDQYGIDPYLAKIRSEALSHVPDLSTKTGRAAIASIAAKVAKSKVYLENAGKQLCDQERAKIDATLSAVMASRKRIKEELDALRDEVRKPLTDWENAEGERRGRIETRIDAMSKLPEIGSDSVAIQKHLKRLEATEIDESFGEYTAEAAIARTHAIRDCQARLNAVIKIEQDLKELEELRIQQAAQAQKDREAEIAKQAAENARIKAEKEAQKKIDEANKFAAELLELDCEAKRLEAEKIAAEERRKNNENNRKKIINQAVESLITYGFNDVIAQEIIGLIIEGRIANVTINF